MHPAVHIANPAEWPGRAIRGMDDCPGTWRASRYRHHDGWLDRPGLTRTRWSEGSTPLACPRDGFALAPDAERALAAEEGWLSEGGGSCPGPPPRPAAVPCSISAMVQGRLTRPDVPRPSARHRGTAVTAQPGCPPPG
jgi:hypothetical protein